MWLQVSPKLAARFPGLRAKTIRMEDVEVHRQSVELEAFKIEVVANAQARWTLDQLREHPRFRAYRDFFWRVGVDPTKIRPASEALLRRVLRGRRLPRINTFVDIYNLASVESAIPLAAFDEERLSGTLYLREAAVGEEFLGIGMATPVVLGGGEPVIEDGKKLVAIYPYRDAEVCKITKTTRDVQLLICGVPNITEALLSNAGRVVIEWITRFCGGFQT
ncbi:MAG: phenylalanine--tRNA ligase beta subunit-related protein [Candidatus Bathyarchaeota archaeon]|nr:phenylalanine--tRNA ligase beta subunit-related protein [Candidatus Bathyarchaeota archaeon]